MNEDLHIVFNNSTTVYKGYVDDPRNTDNAWMETVRLLLAAGSLTRHAWASADHDRWPKISTTTSAIYSANSRSRRATMRRRYASQSPFTRSMFWRSYTRAFAYVLGRMVRDSTGA